MKTSKIINISTLIALVLSACGSGTPAPSAEKALVDVYTAAAMTFNVQSNSASVPSTAGPGPSFTSTLAYPTSSLTAIPTGTVSSYVIAPGCYSAAYAGDVTIPDGTILAPGEAFTKTWKFQNTGTCAWTDYFSITFTSGSDMDGETTKIDQYISPGSTANASVDLIAPDIEGTYTGYWQLADEDGIIFGEAVYVEIVVSSDSATLTPTSTTEPTLTHTIEATSPPTSTNTPTETPTNTPVPIEIPAEIPLTTETATPEPADQ